MIHDIDGAIRTIITRDVTGDGNDVVVEFDAPTEEWAARRNAPTINVYLYDITEDTKRRQVVPELRRDSERGVAVARALPPRRYQLAYLITAWTQRPEDEHRLLSALLTAFLRHPVLPDELLSEALRATDVAVPLAVALPRPEARRTFDIWSSLGGELKPSLDLVVIAPLAPSSGYGEVAPPVLEDPRFAWAGDDLRQRRRPVAPARAAVADAEPETVYGGVGPGAEGRGGRSRNGFGDGRAGRALVMFQDPDGVRRGGAPDGGDPDANNHDPSDDDDPLG